MIERDGIASVLSIPGRPVGRMTAVSRCMCSFADLITEDLFLSAHMKADFPHLQLGLWLQVQ